jgi:hypothetical protein
VEIRRLQIEPADGDRLSAPIVPVTGGARGPIQLLAAQTGAIGRLRIDDLWTHKQQHERTDRHKDRHRAATVARRSARIET